MDTQLKKVTRWIGDEKTPLDTSEMREALLADLQSVHQRTVAKQQRRFGELLKEAGGVDEPTKEQVDASLAAAPAATTQGEGAGIVDARARKVGARETHAHRRPRSSSQSRSELRLVADAHAADDERPRPCAVAVR